jgi:hypothetical protein
MSYFCCYRMKTIAAILYIILITFPPLFSQGEIDEQEKIFYRNERTYAATLSTTGLSGNFRYAKRIDAFKKTLYEIEFAQIKHEKEIKISYSSSQQLGGSFVYGKLNSFYTLRGGIGLQNELFRKRDKGGISIRYFYTFGPSIGFQKPVYYDVLVYELNPDGVSVQVAKRMKFESHIDVEKKAPFYVGLKETTLVPGAFGKVGFTFEFGKLDVVFNAIETGIVLDAFIKKIPIMANDQNHWLFPGFFLSYRFGKVINAQFKNPPTKIDNMLSE